MRPHLRTAAALVGVFVFALAACGSDNSKSSSSATAATAAPTAGGAATSSGGGGAVNETLTVGSANFSENVLLAEIYAQALEAKGAKINRKLNIGNRETYYQALTNGELDLMPEYTNSLLSYVLRLKDKNAVPTATTVQQQVDALNAALPSNLEVLPASTAEDKDVIVCNKTTEDKYGFKTLSDLAAKSGEITLGGPPEFATRSPFGIPGFQQLYNANFKSFVPLEIGTPMFDALNSNAINCANVFSTMPDITSNNLTALDDDKNIVPHEAVLPIIAKAKASPQVAAVLAAVSSKLTTDELLKMMVDVGVNKKAEADVAKAWLTTNGLTS
jgi:osmoprotectant transport system substrate-binding protein